MARITNGTFPGPAGRVEYILNEGAAVPTPEHAAIVCHPHPVYGGTMHTKVVFQATQALAGLGLPVLRFHFRGVGKSEGSYDHGEGEQQDLLAAIEFLRARYPLPLVLAGFSFGSTMVIKTLARAPHPEVVGAVLMGVPADRGQLPTAWVWSGPKLMISGDHDEFASLASLEAYYAALAPPKSRAWIAGGDHFMTGQAPAFRAALQDGLRSLVATP